NTELVNWIYEYLALKLQRDINRHAMGQSIGTLAKWLPREASGFDRKLDWVENFVPLIWKNMGKFAARKQYRQTIARLNRAIGTAEIWMSEKNLEGIDFNQVSSRCLNQNIERFVANQVCRENLRQFMLNKYSKFDLVQFVKRIYLHNVHEFECQ